MCILQNYTYFLKAMMVLILVVVVLIFYKSQKLRIKKINDKISNIY